MKTLSLIRAKLESIKPIPENEWQLFEQLFQKRELKKGDFFVKSGQFSTEFGFIKSGLIRFFYLDNQGNELNQTFKKENEYFLSWDSIFLNKPSSFAIQALEDSTIFVADYRKFEPFLDRHICWPQLCYSLAQHDYLIKAKREMLFLLLDSQERYQNFLASHRDLAPRLTQVQIAAYLGISPETLSRIIKKLSTTN